VSLDKFFEFEHVYNPQHFYCRLIDLGLDQEYAKRMAHIYELGIYQEIMEELNDIRKESKISTALQHKDPSRE